jgi:hypothetical protein
MEHSVSVTLRAVAALIWDKLDGVFGRAGRWVAELPTRVARLVLGLWAGLLALRPWSAPWWRSLATATAWRAVGRWLGYRLVDVLEIFAIGELYETLVDLVKVNTRRLTEEEIRDASTVFGSSVNLRLVRLDMRALLGPARTKRDYTSFHTINCWREHRRDVLIHELTHVWQYERHGAIYMPQALHAQFRGAGYKYGGAAGLREADGFAGFNREQQAQIVQDFYRMRQGHPDIELYASYVREVSTLTTAQLIAGRPA